MDRRRVMLAAGVLVAVLAPGALAQDASDAGAAAWSADVLPQTEEVPALVTGVAVGPDAIVAVGQRACTWRSRQRYEIGRCWGQPWVSRDGLDWEAVEARSSGLDLGRFVSATSGPEIGVEGVAYGPGGYVAYGWANTPEGSARDGTLAPALWRSDDGRAWERIPSPRSFAGDHLMQLGPWLADIVGTDGGYLLVGTIFGTPAPRAAIWSSPDGLGWTLAEDDEVFDIGAYIDTMEVPATGGISAVAVPTGATDLAGAVAVGTACPPVQEGAGPRGGEWRKTYDWTTGSCWPQVWSTEDGTTWEAGTFEASRDGRLPDETWWPRDIASSGDVSVVGADPRLLLFADEGATWTVADSDTVARQVALAAGGAGFLALVPRCTTGTCRRRTLDVWSSVDGSTWDPAASQPRMPSGVEDIIVADIAALGDRLLVTAGYWTAPGGDPASMALLSPPLSPTSPAAAGAPTASAEPTAHDPPDASPTLVLTLPPADAAPLPESIAPPAGTEIAWVEGADSGAPAIHVAEADGGGDTGPLLEGTLPSWAPDGDRLAFECRARGGKGFPGSICISGLGTEPSREVVVKRAWRPRWSPVGEAIAFSRSVIDLGDAWVRDLETGETVPLPGGEPEWSPTGEWLLIKKMSVGDLVVAAAVVRPDGSDERVLGSGWNATWSPDGTRVASTSYEGEVTTVTAIDIESGETEELFAVEAPIVAMHWLPGDTMAIVNGGTSHDLYAVSLEDGQARSLTSGLIVVPTYSQDDGEGLSVSPDGRWLSFAAVGDDARTDAYVASRDGGWRRLTTSGDASDPTWRPEVMPAG